jgi:hypothetical protein
MTEFINTALKEFLESKEGVESIKVASKEFLESKEGVESIKVVLKKFLEYSKAKKEVESVINDDSISFCDKVKLLPKIDPDIHAGYLLLENVAQKKLNTTEGGGRLWNKFYIKYKSKIDELLRLPVSEAMPFIFLFTLISDLRKKLSSNDKNNFRNNAIHEIKYLKDTFAKYFFSYRQNNPTLSDLAIIYNFIKNL